MAGEEEPTVVRHVQELMAVAGDRVREFEVPGAVGHVFKLGVGQRAGEDAES